MRCREYYSPQAIENLHNGKLQNGLPIPVKSCAGRALLVKGSCPECGWKPESDGNGKPMGRAARIWFVDDVSKQERAFAILRKEMSKYVEGKNLQEKLETYGP